MRGLHDSAVVEAWERWASASPTRRAVELLASWSGVSAEEVARWSVGRRDAGLMDLRAATFGATAPCFVQCPACAAALEFEVELAAIRVDAPAGDGTGEVVVDDIRVAFRVPCSDDLLAIERRAGSEDALASLLARCVTLAERRGDPIDPARLPAAVQDAVAAEIERLDPQADVSFAMACRECGHAWAAPFDIAAYLWREIEVAARRLFVQVDALARAYGWSETEILALSPARRRAYLELTGAA